jgi:putative DNA primase/helicase
MNAATRYDPDPAGTVADALRFLSPDCDRDTWVLLGMAVKAALGGQGFAVWDQWSQGSDRYRARDARDAWKSFKPEGRVTAGTLFHLAKQAGWRGRDGAFPKFPPPAPRPDAEALAHAERERHEAAARKAWNIWRHAPLAHEHPYLTHKGVQGHGARLAHGKLVIPLYAEPGRLVNLQFINDTGKEKRFLGGGRKAGCFWWVGEHLTETVCLAEGFATAASIHEATGYRCYVAFDAGNLPAVAEAVRDLHPDADSVVCADNDPAGLKYAELAAERIGAAVAVPEKPRPDLEKWDFNDWHQWERRHGRT